MLKERNVVVMQIFMHILATCKLEYISVESYEGMHN